MVPNPEGQVKKGAPGIFRDEVHPFYLFVSHSLFEKEARQLGSDMNTAIPQYQCRHFHHPFSDAVPGRR